MLVDFGKIIGGPDDGDGLIGKLLGVFALGGAGAAAGVGSGMFDDIGGGLMDGVGGAAADMAGGFGGAADMAGGFGEAAAGAMGEGWFASFFERATFVDYYFMWDVAEDIFSRQSTRAAWGKLSEEAQEVATAHGFMRQQLRANKLDALAEEYERLGSHLPDEALLSRSFKELAKKFHPDQNSLGEALMKTLSQSRDTLKNEAKISVYRDALRRNPGALDEFFAKFTETGKQWETKYGPAAAARMKNRLLEGPAGATSEKVGSKFGRWFSERPANQKIGIAFAAFAGVGAGVYIGAKILSNRQEKKHAAALEVELTPAPSLPSMGLHTQQLAEQELNSTQTISR